MIKWINGSYAHDLSFGRHRVRKLSTRICVSKGRFGCFLSLMKIVATPFHQSVPICIKQIMACKPSGAVVCASKIHLSSLWRPPSLACLSELVNFLAGKIICEFT